MCAHTAPPPPQCYCTRKCSTSLHRNIIMQACTATSRIIAHIRIIAHTRGLFIQASPRFWPVNSKRPWAPTRENTQNRWLRELNDRCTQKEGLVPMTSHMSSHIPRPSSFIQWQHNRPSSFTRWPHQVWLLNKAEMLGNEVTLRRSLVCNLNYTCVHLISRWHSVQGLHETDIFEIRGC